ncbi:hypothetical protein V5799_031298, partial [Amblyomma americanum]
MTLCDAIPPRGGGNLFAVKMRNAGYKTMLDPFQQHFGARMGGLLFLPALCGEVFWSAAILAALGATVEVIVDLGRRDSVIASACIALFYTFTGGLYSVAYTDVVQLVAIFFGLVSGPITDAQLRTRQPPGKAASVLQAILLVNVGGDLTAAGYTKPVPLEGEATSLTLPLVLQYLTPPFVSAMGLGAVSAAVMSSSDSSILSAASMFAWNIYRLTLRQQ